MKRRALTLVLSLTLLAGSACKSDEIDLSYRLEANTVLNYRLTARADASWDIGGQGSGSYEVIFDVTEAIRSEDSSGAIVDVVMMPVEGGIKEDGLPSPGPGERAFSLRVGANGEVLEILEVEGVPAAALDPNELAFIGTYRPPLPPDLIRLHDSWDAAQAVDAGNASQNIQTTGNLIALDVENGAPLAEIRYKGEGPLEYITALPQGEARLEGAATTTSTAAMNIEGGFLNEAQSITTGDFDVTVRTASGSAPIRGTLRLQLELDLEKL
jgi:hypothetical protein